jgi:hypothetical protein
LRTFLYSVFSGFDWPELIGCAALSTTTDEAVTEAALVVGDALLSLAVAAQSYPSTGSR